MFSIFISYKRSDHDLVRRYIREIEAETGAECWFDLAKIETSEQFATVICNAIDQADVFLFMHSASHVGIDFQSDWTIRELNYAMAKKKRIVLVKMDDTPLENMFLMLFGGTNNIQITDPLQKQKLFSDLRYWAAGSSKIPESPSLTTKKNGQKRKFLWIFVVLVCILAVILGVILGKKEPGFPSVTVSSGVDKINGFEYVDLGLPSGLKWARCNVGASEPWEYGNFYAWGEVTPKNGYFSSNLKYYQETGESFVLLKYNDGAYSLGTEDDAASVNMGKSWRLPTKAEAEELAQNCRWERAQLNGVRGEKVTGKNGNSIFFPYAGFKYLDEYREEGLSLSFWTSTISSSHPERAYYLYSGISGTEDVFHMIYEITRYPGTTIRGVTE